jgi:hypothetical protein
MKPFSRTARVSPPVSRLPTALCLALTLALSCSQPQQVHVEHDPAADFHSYRTYAWQPSSPATRYDPRLNGDDITWRIRTAVEQELNLRGFNKDDSATPGLWIRYELKLREKTTVTFQDYYNYWQTGGGKGPQETFTSGYDELLLSLELTDARTDQRVWRGRAGIIADEQEPQRLRDAVRLMFEKWP